MKELEEFLMKSLDLRAGDIVIIEMPYEDAEPSDFFPFEQTTDFKPGHSGIWVEGDKPLAHSTREGYRLPGLRLTNLPDCRAIVYRLKDNGLAASAANIIKTWGLATTPLSLEGYRERYPANEWPQRHEKDLTNFFKPENNVVAAPATPYMESRVNKDLREIHKNQDIVKLSHEGLRRAIKFAARREMAPEGMSKGQRCSPVVIAAFQSALLAEVVKTASKAESKAIKKQTFEEVCQTLFKPGWEETEIGKRLIRAVKENNFTDLFPPTFNVDQRYVTPQSLFESLPQDENIEYVGRFSVFQGCAEASDNKDHVFNFKPKAFQLE